MSRILIATLGYGIMTAAAIGLAAPAQANPNTYLTSGYCTESVQEQTYTLQGQGDVRITEVRPQVVRTCYQGSPIQNIYESTRYESTRHHSQWQYRDHDRSILPPQIQLRLGPNLSLTTGWQRDDRDDRWFHRDRFNNDHFNDRFNDRFNHRFNHDRFNNDRFNRGFNHGFNREHRNSQPIGFPIFGRYPHR